MLIKHRFKKIQKRMGSVLNLISYNKSVLIWATILILNSNSINAFNGLFSKAISKPLSIKDEKLENNNIVQLEEGKKKSILRLFSKLADEKVLVDLSAGKCCYGSCPGCDFLNDDGSYKYMKYTFASNEETSAVMPPYVYRSVGDCEHTSKWSRVVFPEKQRMIKKHEFFEYLSRAEMSPVAKSLDPVIIDINEDDWAKNIVEKSPIVFQPDEYVEDEDSITCDEWAGKTLWSIFSRSVIDGKVGNTLTKSQAANVLRKWNGSANEPSEGLCIESFTKRFSLEQ